MQKRTANEENPARRKARKPGRGARLWAPLAFAALLGPAACRGADLTRCQAFVARYALSDPAVPEPARAQAHGAPWAGPEQGPVAGLRVFAREQGGAVWLGGALGAARFDPSRQDRWDRWRYFYGRRWLPDNHVQNIFLEETKDRLRCWIRTETGVSRIEWRPMSLGEKAALFDRRIEARHVRHGLVASSALLAPGDLASNKKVSSDNDGLWTAIYLGAQAYRYAATGDQDARRKARRALEALMRLEAITGIPGFYARSIQSVEEGPPGSGEWHRTPDGRWQWKGDTSSDESVGHYYAYSVYFDLAADPEEKILIQAVVRRMTDYLIRNGYELLDIDGKPTRWGRWSEAYYQTEEGRYESALRSLELLSFLKTTYHITGDRKYQEAYEDRIRRGYAQKMRLYRRWPGGGEINFSDDELAYLSYAPLLKYERSPRLRKIYLEALRFAWSQVRSDRNPLWNYISVASGAGPMTDALRAESRKTLARIPCDLITWTVRNSHRRDVLWRKELDRHGRRQLAFVLAPDERPLSKWNGNPYIADGGNGGRSEDDGSFFLLPYWMGRFHGWVE